MVKSKNMNASRRQRTRKSQPPPLNVVKFNRENVATITKVATDSGQFRSVTLSQFVATDVISVFQDYRILKLTASYVLVNAPNNNASFPTLFLAPQHIASGFAPASRDEVLQYKGVKHYQFGPTAVRHDRAFDVYVPMDANATGKAFVKSPWLSVATDTVPHYFSGEWISRYNTTADPTHTLELILSAVIECRGIR